MSTQDKLDLDPKQPSEGNNDSLKSSDFTLIKQLRKEEYINYYLVENVKTDNKYFAKILRRCKDKNKEQAHKNFEDKMKKEIEFRQYIQYPSIIKYIGYCPSGIDQKHQLATIMEYPSHGMLSEVIKMSKDPTKETGWNDTKKLINIYGIASAISYLHKNNIIHRNLNPANIYENENHYPLVSNFENAYRIDNDQTYTEPNNTIGYTMYIAPEVLDKQEYSRSSDIYSFGMIIYEIMTSSIPFERKQKEEIKDRILKGGRPEINDNVPEAYKELINKCWSQKPEDRPKIEEILKLLVEDERYITSNVDAKEFDNYIRLIFYLSCNYELQKELDRIDDEIIKSFNESGYTQELRKPMNETKMFDKLKKLKLDSQDYFYEIYEANCRKASNQKFHFKIFYVYFNDYPDEVQKKILLKMRKILDIDHPSILKSINFSKYGFNQEYHPTLVTEYIQNVSLNDIITKRDGNSIGNEFNFTKKLINIYGIASGMSYLHANDLLHYNLTPDNIILDTNLYPKIKDFEINGLFESLITLARIHDFTPYLSPETYTNNEYTKKSEVFSFSFIVYIILNNKFPFEGMNKEEFKKSIIEGNRPPLDERIPKVYQELIKKCWSANPADRPTFLDIVHKLETIKEFITGEVDENEFRNYIGLHKAPLQSQNSENDDGKTSDETESKGAKKSPLSSSNKSTDSKNKKDDNNNNNNNNNDDDDDDDSPKKFGPGGDGGGGNGSDGDDDFEYEEDEEEDENGEPFLVDVSELPFLTDRQKVNMYDYFRTITLGYGATSKVIKAVQVANRNVIYAAKIFLLKLRDAKTDEEKSKLIELIKTNLKREVKNHLNLTGPEVKPEFNHPCIVKSIGFNTGKFRIRQRENSTLMLELLQNGTLKDIIKEEKEGTEIENWNQTKKLINIYGIASAMSYLHHEGILHRDLKSSNILLDCSFYPKVSDFGLSIKIDELSDENVKKPAGTPQYMAPEVWSKQEYSEKSDVYAFGIIVYELMASAFAFENIKEYNIMYKVTIGKKRPELPDSIPECYKKLIKSCWDEDPNKRPKFEEILNTLKSDEFTNNVDKDEYKRYIKLHTVNKI